jgi:hypothetical protein
LLIFGVENTTKELIGIKSNLENLDNRYFSTTIRQGLDGSFDYFFFTGRFLTKIIGFLFVSEATIKPVIVRTNSSDLVRGEIYFRYSAQTTRIEASDLRKIIDDEVQKRLTATMHSLYRIAEIGPENVAIINTENGEIETGSKNSRKLTLSPDALKDLNLIKEGKLVETKGSPAYVVVGEIEIELEEGEKVVEKSVPTLTKETEIYKSFFSGSCDHPEMMIEQILIHQSHYAPAFFFISQAAMSMPQAVKFIENIDSKDLSKGTKTKLLTRIQNPAPIAQAVLLTDIKHYYSDSKDFDKLVDEVKSALNLPKKKIELQIPRTIFFNTLLRKTPIPLELYEAHLKRILEALSHLPKSFIRTNKDFVIGEISKAYNTEKNSDENSSMRKVISNIDMALYL